MTINTEYVLPPVVLSAPSAVPETKAASTDSRISFDRLRSAKESLADIGRKIKASPITRRTCTVISVISSYVLGVLAGLAISGVAITPVGLGIAGASVAIGLAGSALCSNKKQFLNTLKFNVLGFAYGAGFGLVKGAHIVAPKVGLSVIKVSVGMALYMSSALTLILTTDRKAPQQV